MLTATCASKPFESGAKGGRERCPSTGRTEGLRPLARANHSRGVRNVGVRGFPAQVALKQVRARGRGGEIKREKESGKAINSAIIVLARSKCFSKTCGKLEHSTA